MGRKALEVYRRRLLEKEQELEGALAKNELDGRHLAAETQDLADQANHTYNKEFLFQQIDQNRTLLALVQSALRRAQNGDFGMCIVCGEPVDPKRLEAVPWAGHCVACQELVEQGLL
ncbi:MAG: TraR/DksA family transcriptional regulator [Bryobacteraceae bacterium]